MHRPFRSAITIATAAAVVAMLVPTYPVAAAPPPTQVQVANTAAQPVPVTGTVAIAGTHEVTVTNGLTVSSLPPVALADNTVRIDPAANTVQTAPVVTDVIVNESFTRQDENDAATFALSDVDVSAAREVRLSITCDSLYSASCADIVVQVYGDSGSRLYDLDRYTLDDHSATRLYELPGTGFWVTISGVGIQTLLSVSLIGRSN